MPRQRKNLRVVVNSLFIAEGGGGGGAWGREGGLLVSGVGREGGGRGGPWEPEGAKGSLITCQLSQPCLVGEHPVDGGRGGWMGERGGGLYRVKVSREDMFTLVTFDR